ncbi:hypothetical protein LJC06_04000 [Bacteroidales bacterium OttesenSCG-928-I14]|nr:hypothetical protein [Bacteroidales bacterium OttesenSCG-928-I14]
MKKSIFYFLAVLFTASVCTVFSSCEDDDNNASPIISSNGKISGRMKFVEKVYDYDAGRFKYQLIGNVTDEVDELEIFSQDIVNNNGDRLLLGKSDVVNGKFTISLDIPHENSFYTFREGDNGGIKVDNTVRCADVFVFSLLKEGEHVAYLNYLSLSKNTEVIFVYAEDDVSVVGSVNDGFYEGRTHIHDYTVYLKKGWNTLVCTEHESEDKVIYKYKVNNTPNGLIWGAILSEMVIPCEIGKAEINNNSKFRKPSF